MLTQLRALNLISVDVLVEEEVEDKIMPDLTSSLVNLSSLTLDGFSGLVDLEEGLACVRCLAQLVSLDIPDLSAPSGDLVNLIGGLPVTGVQICINDAEHVSQVVGWLEGCVPTTLGCLALYIPGYNSHFFRPLQPSQVACLLSPLRSAGAQLQKLPLSFFDLSEADSVSIITTLTQLTNLKVICNVQDDGWALLEPAFAHLEVLKKDRCWVHGDDGMSWFHAEAASLI